MVLLFHIAVALAGIAYATYLYLFPSKNKMYIVSALTALTLGSGTYLLWNTKAHVLQGCVMGLAYIAGISAALILAGRKLAAEKTKQ